MANQIAVTCWLTLLHQVSASHEFFRARKEGLHWARLVVQAEHSVQVRTELLLDPLVVLHSIQVSCLDHGVLRH